ncbi:hypothetical protein [Shewanella sp. GutDb-MelDb]|uniref:hypothetical protein n=1 Tax=Shewanella sp. GutDb-MelDb TaxID=2058316 RepID=UPI000C7BF02B|nr:hypothetical protein [Shewanella sp. GutDb-MelDb]PKG55585.1 hypothetical protein CXF82_18805 [Shewanella sp. GutDb-MelDb]
MKTELDTHNYQDWFLDNLQYQNGLLTLTLEEGKRAAGKFDPKRFLVVFTDTVQFQIYDECDHSENYHLNRESGVIGRYDKSSLIDYLKTETILYDTTPGELAHFSVMTSNEFIHVVTREIPKVLNVT